MKIGVKGMFTTHGFEATREVEKQHEKRSFKAGKTTFFVLILCGEKGIQNIKYVKLVM